MRLVALWIAVVQLAWTCSAQQFDYIVVGAGAAGCAVSAGLADDGSSVLVVEAGSATMWAFGGRLQRESYTQFGGDTNATIFDVPGEVLGLPFFPDFFWNTAPWTAQGKGIGGSGAVNGAMAFKGVPEDFATWPTGWSFSDLDTFYDEAIGRTGVSAIKSTDGKLYEQAAGDMLEDLMRNQFGFETKALNGAGPRVNSTSYSENHGKGGERFESCQAYLLPVLNSAEKNVELMTNSTVKRILFSRIGLAFGVELEDGMTIDLNPGGKVVVAAGPLNTPRLLMYSGVGPEEELERLMGNDFVFNPREMWIKNEEVGAAMHDHLLALVQVRQPENKTKFVGNPGDQEALSDYFTRRTNFLTQYAVPRVSFLSKPGSTVPDIEIGTFSFELFGFPEENCFSCLELFIMPMRPKSRGKLQIKTEDFDCDCGPFAPCKNGDFCRPDKYLSNAEDREDLIWAIKTMLNALTAEGFEILLPTATDDAGIRAYVAQDPRASFTPRHSTGSCAIGLCTDENLKVRGTENVFVVDSSTFPTPVSAHPLLTTIAIGRKAVDHVKSG